MYHFEQLMRLDSEQCTGLTAEFIICCTLVFFSCLFSINMMFTFDVFITLRLLFSAHSVDMAFWWECAYAHTHEALHSSMEIKQFQSYRLTVFLSSIYCLSIIKYRLTRKLNYLSFSMPVLSLSISHFSMCVPCSFFLPRFFFIPVWLCL